MRWDGSTAVERATKAMVQLPPSKRGATASMGLTHTDWPQVAGGRSRACSAKKPVGSSDADEGTSPRATAARNTAMSCAPPWVTPRVPDDGGGVVSEAPTSSPAQPSARANRERETMRFMAVTAVA
jgi:hypothetical protein